MPVRPRDRGEQSLARWFVDPPGRGMGHATRPWSLRRQTPELAPGAETRYGPLAGERIRILSWNLWWRFGPWEERLPAIVETVRRLDPDIACLQEVWIDLEGDDSSARRVAEAIGAEHRGGTGWTFDGIGFGNCRRVAVARSPAARCWRFRHPAMPTSCGPACAPTSTRPTARSRSSRPTSTGGSTSRRSGRSRSRRSAGSSTSRRRGATRPSWAAT
jgi:hypothetical protein